MKKYIFTLIISIISLFSYGQDSYVDMGTSVDWATSTMNGFYRYGEITPSYYEPESTYRFYSSLSDNLQWTFTFKDGTTATSSYNGGFIDAPLDIAGNLDYDIATTLGEGWRMPTVSEAKELIENSTINASSDNKYFIITSNITGNIIVLPNTGYLTYIGEKKKNMHIMLGQTSICEPRKYVSTICININSTTEPDVDVRWYCSLDKVTSMLPILPVHTSQSRAKSMVAPYNSNTGDVMYEGDDGATYIKTVDGNYKRVKSYTSTSGITTDNPTSSGIYIVKYNNGDTEKVLIK